VRRHHQRQTDHRNDHQQRGSQGEFEMVCLIGCAKHQATLTGLSRKKALAAIQGSFYERNRFEAIPWPRENRKIQMKFKAGRPINQPQHEFQLIIRSLMTPLAVDEFRFTNDHNGLPFWNSFGIPSARSLFGVHFLRFCLPNVSE
jgi:hypothetical protein